MANLARIKEIQARFADRATFLTVYTQGKSQVRLASGYLIIIITEAHPTEAGDYIDYFLPINRHKTLEERLAAAS